MGSLPTRELRRNLLLAAIPHSRVCGGCKNVKVNVPEDWRLTAYGDAVCADCYKQDQRANPDIYSDPLLRKKLWRNAVRQIREMRLQRTRINNSVPSYPSDGTLCPLCRRRLHVESRQQIVHLAKTDEWICKKCYFVKVNQDVRAGQFREDRFGRVFIVTRHLRADYVFGPQQLPNYSVQSDCACETVYIIQREKMWELVNVHLDSINRLTQSCMKRGNLFDETECYDVVLQAACRAATLFNANWNAETNTQQLFTSPVTSFNGYLHKAVHNAYAKAAAKKQTCGNSETTVDHDTLDLQPRMIDYIRGISRQHSLGMEQSDLFKECERIVGTDNWNIFVSWVLHNKTQKDLSIQYGVLPQTICARIQKAKSLLLERLSHFVEC